MPDFRTLGHSTVVIGEPPVLVADPWRWREERTHAALLLVTRPAIDACSPEDLAAAGAEDARILGPRSVASRLGADFPGRVTALAEGETWRDAGVVVRALPAAGVPRARGFLPRGEGLTYLVEAAGIRWLLLGASDALPEHEGLAPDVAFVAVGDFTFPTPEEAADAVRRIRPGLAVPVAWGDLSARFEAARRFTALCADSGIPAVPVRGVRDGS